MSKTTTPATVRKSGRERKAIQQGSNSVQPYKEDDDSMSDEDEENRGSEEDKEDELEYGDSDEDDDQQSGEKRPGPRSRTKRLSKGGIRRVKSSAVVRPAKRRGKQNLDGDGEDDNSGAAAAVVGKDDTVVASDNAIFNAVKNPNTSLQTTVDDWIESYQNDEGAAMAELINFVLRASGCNSTVDQYQAIDEDGIVEVLEEIDGDFKNLALLAYPLVSKSKSYKKFRSSMSSFFTRLFAASAVSEILYDTAFCQTLQAWLTSLSSSKIRSFRHTATVLCLIAVSALCDVSVAVNKEFASASRAKEAEEKKGKKDQARLKALKLTVKGLHVKKEQLEQYLSDIFEACFVHRYRDSEPLIRTECIKALGNWMASYPDYWLEGNYLRYIGWVLSDDNKDVRQEAVRALISLYARDDNIASMQHFTERFKSQLVRMATSEVDLSVRVSCIHVLRAIDRHGLLEEEQRDEVAALIFEEEKRVREGIAGFFAGLVDEQVSEIQIEMDADHHRKNKEQKKTKTSERETRLRFKCLAKLLVKYGKHLDRSTSGGGDDAIGVDDDDDYDEDEITKKIDLDIIRADRGRIAFAVDSLWDSVDILRDWQGLIDYLLLDHSTSDSGNMNDGNGTPKAKKRKSKEEAAKDDTIEVEPEHRLREEEETVLIEVLVASLSKATGSAATTKKERERDDTIQADVSRAVIEALPRFFAKHQTVPARIVDILSIPRFIKLELYLDMQIISAFESLWDDVTQQFLKHTAVDVLDQAVRTIQYFLVNPVLGRSNAMKINELEERLVELLREGVANKNLKTSTFDRDEPLVLAGCLGRISKLYAIRDISVALDDTDEDKLSSAWEIVDALSERGHLGYKSEGLIVEHSLTILYLHISWRISALARNKDVVPEEAVLESIIERRATLLARLEEFSVGRDSNAVSGVKQISLLHLLNLHLLSSAITSVKADPNHHLGSLSIECGEETQARCAGFVQAEIERHVDAIAEADLDHSEESGEEVEEDPVVGEDSESSDSEDEGTATKKKKKQKKPLKAKQPQTKSKKKVIKSQQVLTAKRLASLLTADHFERTIAPFVRAIHSEVLDLRHASVIFVHYEKFGSVFDQWTRLLIQDLKEEGIYGNQGEAVARIIAESFQDAAEIHLSSTSRSNERIISLARLLASATIVRGPQLSILKRLPGDYHVKIHTNIIDYITEKMENYDKAGRKEQMTKAISLFKALSNILTGLDGRASLQVKNALDESIAKHNITVPSSGKLYEPIRAYQKRLVQTAAKDPSIKSAAEAKVTKSTAKKGKGRVRTDVEEGEDDIDDDQALIPVQAKPRARRIFAKDSVQRPMEESDMEDSDSAELPPRYRDSSSKQNDTALAGNSEDTEMAGARNAAGEIGGSDDEEEDDDNAVEEQLRSNGKKRAIPEGAEDHAEDEHHPDIFPLPSSSATSISDMKRNKKKAKRV